jgi:LPXTG-site transpeptidase (sortase) family protein
VSAGVLLVLLAPGCAGAPPAAGPDATVSRPAAAPTAEQEAIEPTMVRIPAIGVASPLLHLGVAADGAAEVPADYSLAGWFTESGRPGSHGPTVLLGHVDSRSGPAVFHRLRELRAGDVVEVDTAGGGTARYEVQRAEQVAKDTFPTFAVFGATPQDVLRLVTCTGTFDRSARSYTDNLVVHATRI